MTAHTAKDDYRLVIERHFTHPRERVYRAWTERDALAAWMGPGGMTCDNAECDLRVGGRYRLPLVNAEGQTYTAHGEYIEISAPERLRFTFGWEQPQGGDAREMLISLSFTETANGTLMTLVQERLADAEARDSHRGGWDSSFDCLEAYLADSQA